MFFPQSKECSFFAKGTCTKGEKCQFSHNIEKNKKSKKMCTFYMKGKCTKGEMCAFQHIFTSGSAKVAAAAPIMDNDILIASGGACAADPITHIIPAVHIPGEFKPQINWRQSAKPWQKLLKNGGCDVCPACLGTPPNDGKTCLCCRMTALFCQDCVESPNGEMCPSCSGEFDVEEYAQFLFTEDNEDFDEDFDEDEDFDQQIEYYSQQ